MFRLSPAQESSFNRVGCCIRLAAVQAAVVTRVPAGLPGNTVAPHSADDFRNAGDKDMLLAMPVSIFARSRATTQISVAGSYCRCDAQQAFPCAVSSNTEPPVTALQNQIVPDAEPRSAKSFRMSSSRRPDGGRHRLRDAMSGVTRPVTGGSSPVRAIPTTSGLSRRHQPRRLSVRGYADMIHWRLI
jgi:hypothetical protein